MKIALIAHDAKKKLMQNFVLHTEEYVPNMILLPRERQAGLWKRSQI